MPLEGHLPTLTTTNKESITKALTLATNAIIGLSVTLQLLMLVNYLVSRQEYILLATATDNLINTINYKLDRTLRSLWGRYYELQDNLTGYKPESSEVPTLTYGIV